MKRAVTVLLVIVVSLSFGGSCNRNRISQESLYDFIEKTNEYIRMIDIGADPVLVEQYDNHYDLKIERGNPITLIDITGETSTSLNLEVDDNQAIARRIMDDAEVNLSALQICLKEGYYTEPIYDASIEDIVLVHTNLTEEGINLFSNTDKIARISLAIVPRIEKRMEENAVRVGNVYMIPEGINIVIKLKDGVLVSYDYGAAFDHKLITWDEVCQGDG